MPFIDLDHLSESLRNRLQQKLPGWQAHLKMATEYHRSARIQPPTDTRKAGVLILLYADGGDIWMPLIQRPIYQGVHSGQMALPGGKVEQTDLDIIDTALRETHEEIGVKVLRSAVLGKLSDIYIPPSNMTVTPVIATTLTRPKYTREVSEVAKILDIALSQLKDTKNMTSCEVGRYDDKPLSAPAYVLSDKVVWGATAMMLSEFLHILDELA